ncbi:hypothetical protein CAC42_1340 [Sphaceloma murrayae]|uniref:Uncharacterized protein n=1 Tax=Sphaceloma murrayae TaxID=2082308 RepID=A0A2K1QG46_9PEZI|nr:hypothetical protein CAC42_1340 [Sphaceloma murrayae]
MPEGLVYAAPTFLTSSKDGYLAIQYYYDWRAPPEKIIADSLLTTKAVITKTWDPIYRRFILHCRDPSVENRGNVGLCGLLKHYDAKDFPEGVKKLDCYADFRHWTGKVAILEGRLSSQVNLPQVESHTLKMQLKYARQQVERLLQKVESDLVAALHEAETRVAQSAKQIQDTVDNSVREGYRWTDSQLRDVEDCKRRGDIGKFIRITDWKRHNPGS